jgi:uncharacterized membrane protein YkgB
MNSLINILTNIMTKFGLLKEDLDYHLIRASMVIIFLFFGYQKWFEYEAQALIPYRLSHLCRMDGLRLPAGFPP